MKKLINDPNYVVRDSLKGIVQLNPNLRLLANSKTVIDVGSLDYSERVAVISGGGAGHEPAHAGYVGEGMLSAAVSGDVFASPSVDEVVDAIRTVHTGAGVLLIVKNYTGDRLNFGLAAEIVRLEGIETEIVLVGDDVALDAGDSGPGARGIAGTVLVHKIAGAAAAAGMRLQQVADRARQAAQGMASMGIALGPCIVPAAGSPSFELPDSEVEWGLGIHGESGVERSAMVSASEIVDRLMTKCMTALGGPEVIDRGVALLVNNLGGSSTMELAIVTDAALAWAQDNGIDVKRVWAGTFLTAMEMPGCSISVMKLGPEQLAMLDAPARTLAWPASHLGRCSTDTVLERQVQSHAVVSESTLSNSQQQILTSLLEAISAMEPELTDMDQVVGDGDLGFSLQRGTEAVLAVLPDLPGHLDELFQMMATIIRRVIGGTSGPLISVMLLRMSEELGTHKYATIQQWHAALSAGVKGIQDIGGAKIGDRTMVDALIPAVAAFGEADLNASANTDLLERLTATVVAAEIGAQSTVDMIARKGRSSYIGQRALGHPDPGAWAVLRIFEALRDTVATQRQATR